MERLHGILKVMETGCKRGNAGEWVIKSSNQIKIATIGKIISLFYYKRRLTEIHQ